MDRSRELLYSHHVMGYLQRNKVVKDSKDWDVKKPVRYGANVRV